MMWDNTSLILYGIYRRLAAVVLPLGWCVCWWCADVSSTTPHWEDTDIVCVICVVTRADLGKRGVGGGVGSATPCQASSSIGWYPTGVCRPGVFKLGLPSQPYSGPYFLLHIL